MQNNRILLLLSLLVLLVSFASAANPTSFCKCTCGSESEIVALDAPPPKPTSESLVRRIFRRAEDDEDEDVDKDEDKDKDDSHDEDNENEEDGKKKVHVGKTCSDCNRQFCLDNNLPGCKKVEEKDIFTQCFQRDSAKDQAVVYIFIIATVGLLGWALLRPWIGKWVSQAKERQSYVPVADAGE